VDEGVSNTNVGTVNKKPVHSCIRCKLRAVLRASGTGRHLKVLKKYWH